jgi:dihydrofolate reductase
VISNTEQWMSIGDDILTDAIDFYKTLDTVIVRSKFFSFLSNYWQAAENTSNSPLEKAFSKQINEINKIVMSRSSVELTWKNSHHLSFKDNQDFIKVIQEMKNQPGKNISVESGIGMWKRFWENKLFDELLLYVHPAIAGSGVKLFNDIKTKEYLKLKSCKTLDRGVVKLNYEK